MTRPLFWIVPIVLWLAIVPFTPPIDMAIEGYFYRDGHFSESPFFRYFYMYGMYPGNTLAIIGAVLFILSFFWKQTRPYRGIFLYLPLVMVIGSGLIVNVILKDHWGQPRPKQVVEFGGKQQYHAIWQPNFSPPEPSKSFPCGHCAMGFYFFSLAVIAHHYRLRRLFWLSLLFAILFGSLLSLTRMAQGGHFFSDVITSALIMWLVAIALFPLCMRLQKLKL